MFAIGAQRFAVAAASACATATALSLGDGGSLAYGSRGGAARCEAAAKPAPTAATAAAKAGEAAAATAAVVDGDAAAAEDAGAERYLAYSASLARLKIVLLKTKAILAKKAIGSAASAKVAAAEGARYVAYSSDVGESMRPVLKPWMVNATYGVAVGYVGYDCYAEVARKRLLGHGDDVLLATGVHKLVFHAAVSLALPAFIIHTAVHKSHAALAKEAFAKMPRLVKYGPTAIGLGLIPFMPLVDPPAEHVLDAAFDALWPCWREGELPHGKHD